MAQPTAPLAENRIQIRALSPADRDVIQGLFLRCADYVRMVTGNDPDPWEADRMLEDVPPGKRPSDKELWGMFEGRRGALVGVVEALRAYPRDDVWFLGLLLLDPAWRGQGLGRWALQEMQRVAAERGARTMHLACVPHNGAGLRFWRREGYREIRLAKQAGVEQPMNVIVMARELPQPRSVTQGA